MTFLGRARRRSGAGYHQGAQEAATLILTEGVAKSAVLRWIERLYLWRMKAHVTPTKRLKLELPPERPCDNRHAHTAVECRGSPGSWIRAPVWIVPRPAACVKLVERLRYHVATMQSAGNDGIVRLLNEAAEELEKMQHESNDMLLRVARLRAALENIVKEYEDNSAAFSIARSALREEDQVKKGGSRRPR
jgi:hypothetical protein